jgi:hypothetical protein
MPDGTCRQAKAPNSLVASIASVTRRLLGWAGMLSGACCSTAEDHNKPEGRGTVLCGRFLRFLSKLGRLEQSTGASVLLRGSPEQARDEAC